MPTPTAAQTSQADSESAPAHTEPKPRDKTVIDSESHVWIPGLGWIVDGGSGSVETMVCNLDDQLTGNKVGIMGGDTTLDGKAISTNRLG